MMRMLWRKMGFLKARGHQPDGGTGESASTGKALARKLETNLNIIKAMMGDATDLVVRRILDDSDGEQAGAIIYIAGLVDKSLVNESVLKPLLTRAGKSIPARSMHELASTVFTAGDLSEIHDFHTLTSSLLEGKTVFLLNDVTTGLALDTVLGPKRSIGEPINELVLLGPQRAFIEDLKTNMAMLRQIIRNEDLVFYQVLIGQQTKTRVCVSYVRGLASDDLINEVKKRLERIDTDGILAALYVAEYVEDNPYSPFPTMAYTERPDVVAAKLLEGRAAILVDGTPGVLTAPTLFVEAFQSPDDYTSRPLFASMLRWFRYIAFFLSIASPALYVALTSFHQELIPTQLLITIAASEEGTPFPVVFELLLMGLIFEILREAGLRMPRQFGQSVSIVGALVLGQAAISSGLVGAPVVMVVAMTAITTFVVPRLSEVGVVLRLIFVILSATMGIIGFAVGLQGLLIHLACLRSFGVPYLSPVAPLSTSGLSDVLIRAPLGSMPTRPKFIGDDNPIRRGTSEPPTSNSGRQHSDNSTQR